MKKLVCLLLVALLTFALCSCGTEEGIRGTVTNNSSTDQSAQGTDSSADTTDTEAEFQIGSTAGNTYKNDFLGLTCTLPSEWVFATDEEIKEMNNLVGDYLDEDMAEMLEQANIVYDMSATYADIGGNININMEKVSALQIAQVNIKETMEAQFANVKSTFENMGYTNVSVSYKQVVVDGKTMDGMVTTAEIQGTPYYATSFMFKKGTYLVNVSTGSLFNDNTETYLGYFKFI